MELTRRVPQAWFGPTADALLATTLLELGDTAEAVALLHEARNQADREGAEAYRLRCLAPLAEATGDPPCSPRRTRCSPASTRRPGSACLLGADAYLCIARAWLQHDEPARARAVLLPLLAAARRLDVDPRPGTAGLVDAQAPRRWASPAAPSAARPGGTGSPRGATGWPRRCSPPATPPQRRRRRSLPTAGSG